MPASFPPASTPGARPDTTGPAPGRRWREERRTALKWPDHRDQRHRHGDDDEVERQPHTPEVAEHVATRPHDQRIVLMTEGRAEIAGGAYRHRDQERIGPDPELAGDADDDRRHDHPRRGVVAARRQNHGPAEENP